MNGTVIQDIFVDIAILIEVELIIPLRTLHQFKHFDREGVKLILHDSSRCLVITLEDEGTSYHVDSKLVRWKLEIKIKVFQY